MIYVFLLISCIVFIELFIVLELKRDALKIVTRSREAMEVIMSSDLDDDQKETFMRRSSVEMFTATLMFLMKFLLIFLALYAMYWLVGNMFPDLREPILKSFVSPIVIVGLTLVAMAYVWLRNVILK